MKISIPVIGGSRLDYPWTPLPILQFKELEPDRARYDAWKAAVRKAANPNRKPNPAPVKLANPPKPAIT